MANVKTSKRSARSSWARPDPKRFVAINHKIDRGAARKNGCRGGMVFKIFSALNSG